MKTKLFTVLAGIILFGACPVQATWTSGHHEINPGDVYGEIWMYNDSTADMWGGDVSRILLFDQSSINIYGGETRNVTVTDNCNMNIYNGKLHSLIVVDNSSATLYGGDIGGIRNGESVPIGTEIDLEIVCKSWAWNEATNHITGIWGDDSLFDIRLLDTYWEDDEPYRMIEHISFTIIPEPASILMLALGGLIVRRRFFPTKRAST